MIGGKKSLSILLVLLMIISLISGLTFVNDSASAYVQHDPIYIEGDADFTSSNGVTGGSGTFEDPFIIEGWEFNAPYEPGVDEISGIEIRNTSAFFVIRDVFFYDMYYHFSSIYLYNVSNGSIRNITVTDCGDGIHIRYSSDIDIADNNISDNSRVAARAFYSDNIAILNNRFVSNFDSIEVDRSENISIVNNNLSDNYEYGLQIYHTNNVLISENNISSNEMDVGLGINQAYNVSIFNNILSSNYLEGISLYEVELLLATDNLISFNRWGILMGYTSNTSIYHNTFIGNSILQARETSCTNISWDNGYPNGGNYWSNYSGEDFFSGPDQDIPGMDSIGDSLYLLEDGIDSYPLVYPRFHTFNQPPVADIVALNSGYVRDQFIFDGSLSYDSDGSIADFFWKFGDGTNSTEMIANHSYLLSGTYQVELIVTDNDSFVDNSTMMITIYHPPHDTILIDGDGGFNSSNGVVQGDGSPLNPFIIDGWDINASAANGIEILNTEAHYILRNLVIHSGGLAYSGLSLSNSSNGRIENSTYSGNSYGIWMIVASNITISGNIVDAGGMTGIWIISSDNISLSNNIIANNRAIGISCDGSENITVTENQIISNLRGGIFFRFVINFDIAGNNVSSNRFYGIYTERCIVFSITDNDISNNVILGYRAFSSHKFELIGNRISANGDNGVSIEASTNHGVRPYFYPDILHEIIIRNNNISDNSNFGMFLVTSSDLFIELNTFSNNQYTFYIYLCFISLFEM